MDKERKLSLGYKEALTQLRQHPGMIWKRNSFFLLIQSGLLAFTLNIESRLDTKTTLVACLAGIFLSFIWYQVNWAGRSLQRKWRGIVQEFEDELFGVKEGRGEVTGPIRRAAEGTEPRESITSALIRLSLGFIGLWVIIFLRRVFL